jgi:hypothetical protein
MAPREAQAAVAQSGESDRRTDADTDPPADRSDVTLALDEPPADSADDSDDLESVAADLPDDLQRLPDLIIESDAYCEWEEIDAAFGIRTIAYTIDTEKPVEYVVWSDDGAPHRTDSIDRSSFSNRCRDRNHIAHFRRRLAAARHQLSITRPMRVVGLVPSDVDRRFASLQMDAIQRAGFEPAEVRSTIARYQPGGEGAYTIVVERINTFDPRRARTVSSESSQ